VTPNHPHLLDLGVIIIFSNYHFFLKRNLFVPFLNSHKQHSGLNIYTSRYFAYKNNHCKEPSGRAAPRISGDGWQRMVSSSGSQVALLCESQSHPAPQSRFIQGFQCFSYLASKLYKQILHNFSFFILSPISGKRQKQPITCSSNDRHSPVYFSKLL
jgi:hypothetical protein